VENLKYAFHFMGACFKLAEKHTHLQKPSLFLIGGSFALLILWALPLALIVFLIGLNPLGLILMGLVLCLIIFSLFVWAEMIGLETCWVFGSLVESDEQAVVGENPVKRIFNCWLVGVKFVFIRLGARLVERVRKLFKPKTAQRITWIDAHYLVRPVISLENLDLAQSFSRVNQMIEQNLLRFRSSLIGVDLIAGMIHWVSIFAGMILGFFAAVNIADPLSASIIQRLFGLLIGLGLGGFPIVLGLVFTTFFQNCYHTALYQWASNVESARNGISLKQAAPPEILRQVLSQNSSSSKER